MREAFINQGYLLSLFVCFFGLGNCLDDGTIYQKEQNTVGETISRGKMKNSIFFLGEIELPRSQVVGYMTAIRHTHFECNKGDKAGEMNLVFCLFLT